MRPTTLIVTFVLPALLAAAPVPKDEKKTKDEDAILGTWKVEKFDAGGAPGGPPPGELEKIRFLFEKDNVLRMLGGPGGEEMKGTFKLDPSAKVKAIDLTMTDGPGGKPETVLGVYELEGDTLRLCFPEGAPGKPRPTELKAQGNNSPVVTFTRVKDAKKDK